MIKDENTPTIETERLILRRFDESDLLAYFHIMSDEKANVFLPWFTVKTMDEAYEMMKRGCLADYERPSAYSYAICLKEDNIPIGYCGLSGTGSNDVGYGLRAEYWRKGIVTEAVAAMVKRIKGAGYPFITATHDVNNPRSGEVMRKLGMKYMYSYDELWQPKGIIVTFRMYQLNFTEDSGYTYMKYWNESANHFIEKDV